MKWWPVVSKPVLILLGAVGISLASLVLFILWVPEFNFSEPKSSVPRIYFADNISNAHQRLIERFNQKYAGQVEVEGVDLPFSKFSTNERKEILTRALRSKSTRLDVFAVDLIWISRFARWSIALDNHFTPADLASLSKDALASCYYHSRLFGAPFYIDVGMMYYRKDILRRLPDASQVESRLKQSITWDELIDLHKRLQPLSEPFYLYAAEPFEGLMCSFIETIVGQGGQLVRGDSLCLTTPEAIRGLQLLIDLVHRYKLSPMEVCHFREGDVYSFAQQQGAVFFRGWPGNLLPSRSTDPEKFNNIGLARIPHFRHGNPKSVFGGWHLMISRYSKHQQEAVTFVKFAQSLEAQEILYDAGGYMPVNEALYADSAFCRLHPDLSEYRPMLSSGFHRPALEEYTKISDIITSYLHQAIAYNWSAVEALHKADQQIRSERIAIK
jgi:multiple sugar transport system substrate-binding protein